MNEWKIIDPRNGNESYADTRAEAEERAEEMQALGVEVEIEKVGASDSEDETPRVETHSVETVDPNSSPNAKANAKANADPNPTPKSETDGGATMPPREDLPDEPSVSEDPLSWIPSDFIDHIDGQAAINRKGYDVLAHHYNISVTTEVLVSPVQTDFHYAEVVATAVTEDGVEYAAHGSAHVDRGDDSHLLLEMADTRAAKRATARATGVGMVAVQELQNEL